MSKKKRDNKYNAKKVWIDDIKFDSQKESQYYLLLRILKERGKIADFDLQVKFTIFEGFYHKGVKIRDITYTCDFIIHLNDGNKIIVDVKSGPTDKQIFRNKVKLLLKNNPDMDFWIVKTKGSRFIVEPLHGSISEEEAFEEKEVDKK